MTRQCLISLRKMRFLGREDSPTKARNGVLEIQRKVNASRQMSLDITGNN